MQACSALRFDAGPTAFRVQLLDAALVAPASSPFMPFQPAPPDLTQGVRVNLYNNKWGTNFPMWWEGSVAFRFIVTVGAG